MRRFKVIFQRDAMQCGVAALAMVCRHFAALRGNRAMTQCSLETVERHCFATTQGVSLKGIADAAHSLGLDTACGRMSLAELAEVPLPAILHWNQNHFVVLHDIKVRGGETHYCIADPGKGKYRCTAGDMQRHWTSTRSGGVEKGVAMLFEPTERFGASDDAPATERRSFRFLMGYVKQYRRYFLHILLGLGLGSVMQLIMPFLTQWIVDLGIHHRDIGLIWLILLWTSLCSLSIPCKT